MKILILGASGFCGSYIKKYFTDRGYTVYGTYRHFRTAYREDLYMLPFSVEEPEKITGILQEIKPQVVISRWESFPKEGNLSVEQVMDHLTNPGR